MHQLIRVIAATGGLAVILAAPTRARATPEMCSPWTDFVQPFNCNGQAQLRTAYCESIAPAEVLELCTVCAGFCSELPGGGSYEYMCYATHEESCSSGGGDDGR